ncbi:3-mercaptopyruvate sulfurtransferase [Planococcus antarcticus DSM 14505]|uniref:Sulfurtransferase n=1 Tax=Planococcus antarcticus DSM 14505 TaxID=1185653 RepID=A0A1C7DGL8_9BACL|nr:sulfurtransferase [Planococcus antarcticus]ANU10709.1 sulfurtransferase [Planococcus antarcticus DSM 14505]EIM06797.1 3-mercaptopyruvate sulfurtransferase [Planococcus antarcticus DSM 14505]
MSVFIETTDTENHRWIDTRFDLKDSSVGRNLYEQEHVAGAIFWDLEIDMSDMLSLEGRHPMPSNQQLTELIRSSGLNFGDSIVIYDQGGSPYAARAWWLLKYAGFEKVYISQKGFNQLKEQEINVNMEVSQYQPTEVKLDFIQDIFADQTFVKNINSGDELGVLVDARSAERYAGLVEPIDPVAGRIPGARNLDWMQFVSEGEFQLGEDISHIVQKHEPAVVYCGSGVTAAALYAIMSEKGYDQLRLYMGSYSDWITDAENVVEFDRGEHPEAADDETKKILANLIAEGYSGEMLMKKFEYEKSLLEGK